MSNVRLSAGHWPVRKADGRGLLQDFAHHQDDQLQKPEFPGKAIALSVSLLCCGITLLTLGLLHLRGHIFSKDGAVSVSEETCTPPKLPC